MIRSFRDRETRDIYEAADTKRARRRLPTQLWARARKKLDHLHRASGLIELSTPSNSLELLSGDRDGQYSIRINRQYRICFDSDGTDCWDVEITDYH